MNSLNEIKVVLGVVRSQSALRTRLSPYPALRTIPHHVIDIRRILVCVRFSTNSPLTPLSVEGFRPRPKPIWIH